MSEEEAAAFCGVSAPISPVRRIEEGDILTSVEALYTSDNTNAAIEYKVYKNQPYFDVKLTVEYADKNKLLRIKIPAPNGKLFGDGPYIIEEKAKNEVTFQKWLGVRKQNGETFAVINDGVYSGKGGDGCVYLTLLRGAGYCFHPIESRELFPKDRYLPRIENGRYVYQMRIITGTQNEVSAEAELFNQKPYAINIFPSSFKENKKFIEVDSKFINGIEYFKYTDLHIYQLRDFNTFLKLIEKGIIKVTFKIGVVRIGDRKGKISDHGTSFSISKENLSKLYIVL
jgi:alpha-mannosidase